MLPALVLALAMAQAGDSVHESFDDLADGVLPAGWTVVSGSWGVRDRTLVGAPDTTSGEAFLLLAGPAGPAGQTGEESAGPGRAADLALEADVVFEGVREPSRWVALVVCAEGSDAAGVQFTVRQDASRGNGLEIAAHRPPPADGWSVFKTGSTGAPLRIGEHHRLRVEVRGRWIDAWLDGERVMTSARAAEGSAGGRVGFRLHGARVVIDDVRLERLGLSGGSARPVCSLPLVIAHRGFSWVAPENTLVSYRRAIEAGAEMAECDVWLSKDRVPVLLHDESLKRTTGHDGRVGELDLAELRRLDAGSWKDPRYAGEPIPTLRDVLEAVRGKLRLVIEIKQPGMEREVLEAIEAARLGTDEVMIFAFDRSVVARIVDLASTRPAGPPPVTWLIGEMPHDGEGRRKVLRQAIAAHASAIGLPLQRVDPELVRQARSRGLSVYVWTVDEPADMCFLTEIGVDGIITDRPDLLNEVLEGR